MIGEILFNKLIALIAGYLALALKFLFKPEGQRNSLLIKIKICNLIRLHLKHCIEVR